MLRVGITGGIGSGKTTVARVFEVLGIPVYYADEAARQLMNGDEVLKANILQHFGADSYVNDELNRAYIASIVFNNAEKLTLLNSLVHPVTIEAANKWMQLQSTPYVIKEAALLFESDAPRYLDKIIGVYAPASLRIQRSMHRDGISREAVIARMDKQINEVIKMRLCDYVITNDEQQLVIHQVLKLHEELLKIVLL